MTLMTAARCVSRGGAVIGRAIVGTNSSNNFQRTTAIAPTISSFRTFATTKDGDEKKNEVTTTETKDDHTVAEVPEPKKDRILFGLGRILDLEDMGDGKIPTDRSLKPKLRDYPEYLPEDIKKDMDELEFDTMEELYRSEPRPDWNDLGLVPPPGAGTFLNPIQVPSRRATRAVGYVDPESHAVYWFNINNDNNLYYIKDLGLFFIMLHFVDEDAFDGLHLKKSDHH